MNYFERLIEPKISKKLRTSGAILVVGPKFCGKTTTSKLFSKSMIQLQNSQIVQIIKADPRLALVGEKPHLIDEWQIVPDIWNYVRTSVDENRSFGEFILTGSVTPLNTDEIYHSGAGRITRVKMRTLSLTETKESKGIISLKDLFNNQQESVFDQNENYSIERTAYYICRGGWPLSIQDNEEDSLETTKNYYDGLFNFNSNENSGLKNRNPEILRALLKSYARNISTETSYSCIYDDLTKSKDMQIERKTFDSYVDIAKNLYLIEDVDAWTPNLRSKTAIRTSPTRHFVDTSIACLALGISKDDLLSDSNTFGLFFEDFVVKELRIYAETLDGEIKHFRNKNGLECDAVIHLNDSKYALVEIKLGSNEGIEEGAKNLNKITNDLDESMNKPIFSMIITAAGPCYKRNDGIYVVPINILKD